MSNTPSPETRRRQRLAEAARLGIEVSREGNVWWLRGAGVDVRLTDLADLSPKWCDASRRRPWR